MPGRPVRRARLEAAGLPVPSGSGVGHGGPARGAGHGRDCTCAKCVGAQPDNDLAVTHGSYRSDLVLSRQERVAELAAAIWETQPVSHPADEGGVWRLALVYRRLEQSAAALDVADEAVADKPTLAYADGREWLDRLRADHDRWLRAASKIESELGRTPLARSRLGLNVAAAQKLLGADLVERYGGVA